MQTTSPAFKENARRALVDAGLQESLARSKPSFQAERTAAVMGLPEFERPRDIGREIKNHTLAHPDFHLERYAEAVERAGGTVHRCSTAEDARAAVLDIRRKAGARAATKGKSMVGEELGINGHLERHGITPVETDLGEYIIQLRCEHPSHIIAPALHLNREDWEAQFRLSHTDLLVGAYEDAWDLLRAERRDPVSGGFMPRNVMAVTGPSRSADIEQTLELGAPGPRRSHVVPIEDDPAALTPEGHA